VVASPTQCHEKTVCGALEHGKHVFCEKPVAQDSSGSERCYRLAADRGKTLFCAFNRYGSGADDTNLVLELLYRDFCYSYRAYIYNQHINSQMYQMKHICVLLGTCFFLEVLRTQDNQFFQVLTAQFYGLEHYLFLVKLCNIQACQSDITIICTSHDVCNICHNK